VFDRLTGKNDIESAITKRKLENAPSQSGSRRALMCVSRKAVAEITCYDAGTKLVEAQAAAAAATLGIESQHVIKIFSSQELLCQDLESTLGVIFIEEILEPGPEAVMREFSVIRSVGHSPLRPPQ